MTTERTLQDVLRELRRELDRRHFPADQRGPGVIGWNQAIDNALELIDKAIAETPDSPRPSLIGSLSDILIDLSIVEDDRRGLPLAKTILDRLAPDTLSEKPGLDVERLQRIAKAADFRASVKFDKGWHGPDLLDGIAAWMDRIDEERGQPDHSVQTDMRRWAKELRTALGSTDSEGR